ncbi:DUF3592 domain-containing protein [Yoonia sp. 2307UL14-13]|uniref:DUF3592 domain-containing protein n=1 Tax=Yoonia sp. 2307UL14-13 TaxID=3126506 RepID=UPI0030B25C91
MKPAKDGSFSGNFVLVVVTIAFAIGVIPMVKIAFGPVFMTITSSDWRQVDAVVLSSVLDQPDRRQYRVKARYTYDWDGDSYVADRVFFDDMVGVRRTYYANVIRTLLRHSSRDNPIPVWVDPDNPNSAVIYRHIRWDKLAGNMSLFGIWALVTTGLVGACIATVRGEPEKNDGKPADEATEYDIEISDD